MIQKRFRAFLPDRTTLRGLKVSVPSNYVTREQSSDGVANYMRNTTSGLVDSTYQDWDGAFATDKTLYK